VPAIDRREMEILRNFETIRPLTKRLEGWYALVGLALLACLIAGIALLAASGWLSFKIP